MMARPVALLTLNTTRRMPSDPMAASLSGVALMLKLAIGAFSANAGESCDFAVLSHGE
jgi:hypothetical protein